MAKSISPALWPKEVLAARMRDDLQFQKFHPGVESEHGVVSCSAYGIAAEVGADVLRKGGNAMDAGLATAMTQIVFSCGDYVSFAGIMAGIYYDARRKKVFTIDAIWNAPMGETDGLTIPKQGELGDGRTALAPGFMAGVDACIRRFGTFSLAELLEPAIFFADEGFQLVKMGKHIEEKAELLSRFPETRALFYRADGKIHGEGDWFKQPRLAQTLRKLAEKGVDYMYRGAWAKRFVDTVQAAGGKLTLKDLARYRADIAEPKRRRVFGLDACVHDGPIFGGGAVVGALAALEADDTARLGHYSDNGPALVRFCQALSYVEEVANMGSNAGGQLETDAGQRLKGLFGDAFDPSDLAAPKNLELFWKAVDEGRYRSPAMSTPKAVHSDCITVIDRQGNMLCMTHSANQAGFGYTGLSVDGIMITDSGSLNGSHIAHNPPGSRIPAALAPIMFLKDGEPRLALSSIGVGLVNKTICHSYNVLRFGMDVAQAQHAPAVMAHDYFAPMFGHPIDPSFYVDASDYRPEVLDEARGLGLSVKDASECSLQYDVNGGPTLDGFTVGVQRKDGKNLAVGVNWMNSKAVAE